MEQRTMSFHCTYTRTYQRDEKTGKTVFWVRPDDPNVETNENKEIFCIKSRNMCRCVEGTPLYMTATWEEREYKGEKRKYWFVKECKACSHSTSDVVAFLSSREFEGVGPSLAAAIAETAGEDIFSFCMCSDAIERISNVKGVSSSVARALVVKVQKYAEFHNIIRELSEFGITSEDAEAVFKLFGIESMEQIRKNPYILYKAGVPFNCMEQIARKIGVRSLERKRVLALIYECFHHAEQSGNTCMTLPGIFKEAKRVEKAAGCGYHTDPMYLAAILYEEKKNFSFIYRDKEPMRIFRRQMYELEGRAAKHVIRLVKGGTTFPTEKVSVEEIEEMCGIKYDEGQRKAFDLMKSSGVKILTGGPGTGKSTTIKGLITYYLQMYPEASIAMCAPTGAAAKRMREITGDDAVTIHKLLNVQPFGKGVKYRDEYDQLSYDLVIADEFSMVDIELFSMLVSGLKTGALLLIAGDEDQLKSVGPGNVLHDLMEGGHVETCRLTTVHRQKGDSSIASNSIKIREGNIDLVEDASFEIYKYEDIDEMGSFALKTMCEHYDPEDINRIKIFTPVRQRKYSIGTEIINEKMQKKFNAKSAEETIVYNGIAFAKGDPVIMLRNDYKQGYMNGDQGFVYNVHKPEGREPFMDISIDGQIITIVGKFFDDVDLAYAQTIHKAQGSECDIAVIVIPEKPKSMLERNLVYVAATRAKKKNFILVQGDALKRAVEEENKEKRITGLNARLDEQAKIANNEKT